MDTDSNKRVCRGLEAVGSSDFSSTEENKRRRYVAPIQTSAHGITLPRLDFSGLPSNNPNKQRRSGEVSSDPSNYNLSSSTATASASSLYISPNLCVEVDARSMHRFSTRSLSEPQGLPFGMTPRSAHRSSVNSDVFHQFINSDENSPNHRGQIRPAVDVEHDAAGTLASMAYGETRGIAVTVRDGVGAPGNPTSHGTQLVNGRTLPLFNVPYVQPITLRNPTTQRVEHFQNLQLQSELPPGLATLEVVTFSQNPFADSQTNLALQGSMGTRRRQSRSHATLTDSAPRTRSRRLNLRVNNTISNGSQGNVVAATSSVGDSNRAEAGSSPRQDQISNAASSTAIPEVNVIEGNHSPRTSSADFVCHGDLHCRTRENPRKALSHFFGRNKTETKRIPDHAWHYVCRKHYQRGKYRGGRASNFSYRQKTMLHEQVEKFKKVMGTIHWTIQYHNALSKDLENYVNEVSRSPPGSIPPAPRAEVKAAYELRGLCGRNKTTKDVQDFISCMYEYCKKHFGDELLKVEFLAKKWGQYLN